MSVRFSKAQGATLLDAGGPELMAITEAGANVLVEKLKKTLENHTRTGKLAESIKITKFDKSGTALVGPSGTHHGSSGKRKKGKHHGKTGSVTAQEVGYYLEHGTPRMRATHWMSHTVENSEDEIVAAMAAKMDELIK